MRSARRLLPLLVVLVTVTAAGTGCRPRRSAAAEPTGPVLPTAGQHKPTDLTPAGVGPTVAIAR